MRMVRNGVRRGWMGGIVFSLGLLLAAAGGSAQEEAVESLRKQGKVFATIAREASPAVVSIAVESQVEVGAAQGGLPPGFTPPPGLPEEFFDRFFRRPGQEGGSRVVQGKGSGFLISADGYILTNHHVVGEADRITVRLLDKREFDAELVGSDPLTDVAVIRIDAENLPTISLGDSETIEVGEWVLAIGNPLNLSHTVTAGIVSAKGRSAVGVISQGYEDFIQTDAAINPGNSGGPLVNLAGEAVGMNTAIASRTGGNIGIGFAIPINMARDIYEQIVETGTVTRGFLGIYLKDLTQDLATYFDLESTDGVVVNEVIEDTPAHKAGLQAGDVIVRMNGEPIGDAGSFRNTVASMRPGTEIDLAVVRKGTTTSLTVTLGTLPDQPLAQGQRVPGKEETGRYGISLQEMTGEIAESLGYPDARGVLVTAVEAGSPASRKGLSQGMRILEVNNTAVDSLADFRRILNETKENAPLLLYVQTPDGRKNFLVVEPK